MIEDGDVVTVTADRYAGTIQVRVDEAHNGAHAIVLPYGARLGDVLVQLHPNALAEVESLQLYRASVATRQKEMLNVALDKLEETTFNARSSTQEEATLRLRDAELVKQFIVKARQVEPKGLVVLNPDSFQNVILEQGEVAFPNGIEYSNGLNARDYIEQVGGFSQKSNKSKGIELTRDITQVIYQIAVAAKAALDL